MQLRVTGESGFMARFNQKSERRQTMRQKIVALGIVLGLVGRRGRFRGRSPDTGRHST